MGYNSSGSSVHGILQARILEWVAIPFSRGSSRPRDQTQVSCTASAFFTIWATREAQGLIQTYQNYILTFAKTHVFSFNEWHTQQLGTRTSQELRGHLPLQGHLIGSSSSTNSVLNYLDSVTSPCPFLVPRLGYHFFLSYYSKFLSDLLSSAILPSLVYPPGHPPRAVFLKQIPSSIPVFLVSVMSPHCLLHKVQST